MMELIFLFKLKIFIYLKQLQLWKNIIHLKSIHLTQL